jgi:hypothetical protein
MWEKQQLINWIWGLRGNDKAQVIATVGCRYIHGDL